MRDFDIRLALKDTALLKFQDNTSIIVEELSLPCAGARIDIAVVNGSLHGYEIKSASDTLVRLPGQIEAYSKVFDYLSIVTEEKHVLKIKEAVPNWVGISYFKETNGLLEHIVVRASKLNTRIEGFFIAKLLRKEELRELLKAFEIPFKKSARAWTLCEILSDAISVNDISEAVRYQLKQRTDWKLFSKAGLRSLQNGDCVLS